MALAWGAKVSPQFREIVIRRSPEVGCDPSHLMACMAFETGRTFDPAKKNPLSTATGLIQFMAATAIDLGTTVEALARMSAEEQLDYVFRYLNRYRGRIGSLPSLYMSILWPAAIQRDDDEALFSRPSREYEANKGLDANGDGVVTKREASAPVARLLAEGLKPENAAEVIVETVVVPEPVTPIEDVGIPARPEDATRITQETSVAPVAFILPLLQSLFQVFTPIAQAKLTQTLNKQTGDPVISGQMAQQILDIVKNAAGQASAAAGATTTTTTTVPGAGAAATVTTTSTPPVSTADDVLAAAAAVQRVKNDPALAAQAEAQIMEHLERMGKVLDRVSELEQISWKAEEDSRAAAATRAQTDTFDFGRVLAISGVGMVGALILFVAAIIILQLVRGEGVGTEVWAALTGLIGWVTGQVGAIYNYRFGSSRGSAAKDVIINEMNRGQGQPIVSASPTSRVTATVTSKP